MHIMRMPNQILTRIFVVVLLTIALYVAGALAFGWRGILQNLRSVPPSQLVLVAMLSLVNYALRFWRWERFLRQLHTVIPLRASLGIYFSAYVMVITPGKVGEVFKAGLLKDRQGAGLAVGLPIILAERIYDFLGVMILAVVGLSFWPGPLTGLTSGLVAAAALPAFLLLLRNKRLRQALLARVSRTARFSDHGVALNDALSNFGALLQPARGISMLALSTVAWLCEALGMYLVCQSLGLDVGIGDAVFIYAAGTIVGSLSFLPGGLGGTEATIVWLLGVLGAAGSTAASAAILIRVFTLWLAVVLGFAAMAQFRQEIIPGRSASETD